MFLFMVSINVFKCLNSIVVLCRKINSIVFYNV